MATRQVFAFQGGGWVTWDEVGANVRVSTPRTGYGAAERDTMLGDLVDTGRDRTEIFMVDTKKGRVRPMSTGEFKQFTLDHV